MKTNFLICVALLHASVTAEELGDTSAIVEVSSNVSASPDVVCTEAFSRSALQPPFYIQMFLSAASVVVNHFAFPITPNAIAWHSWPLVIFSTASALYNCIHDLTHGMASFMAGLTGQLVIVLALATCVGLAVLVMMCCGRCIFKDADVISNCFRGCATLLVFCSIGLLLGGLALYFIFRFGLVSFNNCGSLPWIYGAKQFPKILQATIILGSSRMPMPMSKKIAALPFAFASLVYIPTLISTGLTHVLPAAFWFFPVTVLLVLIQGSLFCCIICATRVWQGSRLTSPVFLPEQINGYKVLLPTKDDDTFVILAVPDQKISFLHSRSLVDEYQDTEAALPGQVIKGTLVDGWLRVQSKADVKVDEDTMSHDNDAQTSLFDCCVRTASPTESSATASRTVSSVKFVEGDLPPMKKKVDPFFASLNLSLESKLLAAVAVVFWQFLGEAMVRQYDGSSWKHALFETWNARQAAVFLSHLDSKMREMTTYFQLV